MGGMRKEILRMENITLEENGEAYLDNLSFYVLRGEIMGLIVADLKGSRQLIDLVCINRPIQFGRVYFEGELVNQYAYSDLSENRVYVIEERGRLIDSLSVSDNLFVMRRGFKKYIINNKVLEGQVNRLMTEMGLSIDPHKRISALSAFERCTVELVKAKLMGCRLVVLDRISNFLSQKELWHFQEAIREFGAQGISFLYIGNHHQEVFQVADRAAVFHQGIIWKVFEKEEMTDNALDPYAISFDLSGSQIRMPEKAAVLEFDRVRLEEGQPLSFSLHRGECLMILDQDNRTWESIAQVMAGNAGIVGGRILVEKKPFVVAEPTDFLSAGVAVIPDDPVERFLFREMSYMENLTFLLDRKVKYGNLKSSYFKSVRREYHPKVGPCIDSMNIGTLSVRELYGLAYYRIHLLHPKVAVCVQPLAKGDMYCRRYVLDLIQELKNSGISVLILTSNIADNMDVSDRMIVLQNGAIAAEYEKEEFGKAGWHTRPYGNADCM